MISSTKFVQHYHLYSCDITFAIGTCLAIVWNVRVQGLVYSIRFRNFLFMLIYPCIVDLVQLGKISFIWYCLTIGTLIEWYPHLIDDLLDLVDWFSAIRVLTLRVCFHWKERWFSFDIDLWCSYSPFNIFHWDMNSP